MSSDNAFVSIDDEYRKVLKIAVAALCKSSGFESCQESALETLTEILQSYLTEIGKSTRSYCEVAGRSITTFCDVHTSLVSMGCQINKLKKSSGRGQPKLGKLIIQQEPVNSPVLQVGTKAKYPEYVSRNITFPSLPDPHTYRRTLAGHMPESDYSILRENESAQKWNIERALTRFVAKTGSSHYLLEDDKSSYPLIASNPVAIPYLNALLPSESESRILSNTYEETNKKASKTDKKKQSEIKDEDWSLNKRSHFNAANQSSQIVDNSSSVSHNPYLRSVKKPKRRKQK